MVKDGLHMLMLSKSTFSPLRNVSKLLSITVKCTMHIISPAVSEKVEFKNPIQILRESIESSMPMYYSNIVIFVYNFSSPVCLKYFQEEYKHLQASSTNSSAPNSSSSATSSNQPGGMVPPMSSEAEILHEAKMLREHKDRLESRMKLLEVHNNQLEMQLGKLRTLLNSDGTPMVTNGNTHPSITSNKTGTLNTKSVTASQLATNSPVLPHKLNGNGPAPPSRENGRGDPPALPPRGVSVRSASNKPPPPAVPPKRSSLTRSDLALFENVSTIYSSENISSFRYLSIVLFPISCFRTEQILYQEV